MNDESEGNATGFAVPKHVRFARALALVSGISLSVAAGVTVFTTTGCDSGCAGICGGYYGVAPPLDGSQPGDASQDRDADAGSPADASGAGGGPLPAPPLPAAWLA
jgi:hypothetical protein